MWRTTWRPGVHLRVDPKCRQDVGHDPFVAGGLLEVFLPLGAQLGVDDTLQGGAVHLHAAALGFQTLQQELVELVGVHSVISPSVSARSPAAAPGGGALPRPRRDQTITRCHRRPPQALTRARSLHASSRPSSDLPAVSSPTTRRSAEPSRRPDPARRRPSWAPERCCSPDCSEARREPEPHSLTWTIQAHQPSRQMSSDGSTADRTMHHIGLGRTLDGTRVILLINGYHVRVIHAATGEIIRTLTIDPERRYHGTRRPPGGPTGPRKTKRSGP